MLCEIRLTYTWSHLVSEKTGTKHGTAFVLQSEEKTLALQPSQWTLRNSFISETNAAIVYFPQRGAQSSSNTWSKVRIM